MSPRAVCVISGRMRSRFNENFGCGRLALARWRVGVPTVALFIFALSFVGCSLPKGVHDDEPDYSPMAAPNYKAINSWIVNTRCIECHSATAPKGDIDLSSYEKIINATVFPPLIIPGNPEKSLLYESVATGRMPKGKRPLKKRELQAIYDWIKNGAKNEDVPSGEPRGPGEPGEPGGQRESGGEPGEPGGANGEPGGASEPGTQNKSKDEPGIF